MIAFFAYNFVNGYFVNALITPVFGISSNGLWLVGAFAAALGSVLPDQIEPATHWTHRAKFHSKKALKFTIQIFGITAFIGLFSSIFFYIASFFLGYLLHLLVDSTTKMGLPSS
jgi:Predicted membrane-bound metal-dependent hydrolase (DUF457).